jgi:hypothetical protein
MTHPLSDPNHPMLLQGRRHAREALYSASRFARIANLHGKSPVTSLAVQMVVGCALLDGDDAGDVFGGLGAAVAALINRLPPQDRETVLAGVVQTIAELIVLPADLDTLSEAIDDVVARDDELRAGDEVAASQPSLEHAAAVDGDIAGDAVKPLDGADGLEHPVPR